MKRSRLAVSHYDDSDDYFHNSLLQHSKWAKKGRYPSSFLHVIVKPLTVWQIGDNGTYYLNQVKAVDFNAIFIDVCR